MQYIKLKNKIENEYVFSELNKIICVGATVDAYTTSIN